VCKQEGKHAVPTRTQPLSQIQSIFVVFLFMTNNPNSQESSCWNFMSTFLQEKSVALTNKHTLDVVIV